MEKIDWKKLWREFNKDLDLYEKTHIVNSWRYQQRLIRKLVEKQLGGK